MVNDQKEFILTANITKVMWKLSLPAIIAMMLFGLNAFMDTIYIGQFMNETALAGIAIAYPLTSMFMGVGSLAGTGAGNLLSIALGKKDEKTQQSILANANLLMIFSTLIFAIPAYIFSEELIDLMGAKGEVKTYALAYFNITLIGSPFWIYGLGLNFIVRAEGKMKEAAIMMAYGLGLNLILTPVFIQYFDLGIEGAAWGTNLGMLLYTVIGYFYFNGNKPSFSTNINSIRYNKEIFSSILKLGFPGFILSLMGLIQSIVTLNAISIHGTEQDLAFFAAANRIVLFLMTPLFGLMRALQPVSGINFGASQTKRVRESLLQFIKTGFFIVSPFWLILTIFPHESLSLMLPDIPLTNTDILNFRVYILVLPFLPIVFMALTYFPAIEKPKVASIAAILRQILCYIPLMILLPIWFGVSGIYFGATAIDIVLTAVLSYLIYQSLKKLPLEK